jgi:biotin transporter BioY
MYIVAIGWIYVILMMAATERNFVSGVLTFLLYGVLPLAIIALLFGRRRRTARSSDEAADRNVDQHDRADAERDQ